MLNNYESFFLSHGSRLKLSRTSADKIINRRQPAVRYVRHESSSVIREPVYLFAVDVVGGVGIQY